MSNGKFKTLMIATALVVCSLEAAKASAVEDPIFERPKAAVSNVVEKPEAKKDNKLFQAAGALAKVGADVVGGKIQEEITEFKNAKKSYDEDIKELEAKQSAPATGWQKFWTGFKKFIVPIGKAIYYAVTQIVVPLVQALA